MENKKDFTVEELTEQYEEAKKNFEKIQKQLKQAKQDEEDDKRTQLALEKEKRTKEVDDAIQHCIDLLVEYMNDYEIYTYKSTNGSYNTLFKHKSWCF